MTKGSPWVQGLIDDHAGDILNYINKLPLSEYDKGMLEIKAKELLMHVASKVMHETKDTCIEIMRKSLGVVKK